jgi:signal transduction histidine kinase
VVEVDRLQNTVVTMLGVARDVSPTVNTTCDVSSVCADIAARWSGRLAAEGRPLRTDLDPNLRPARCPADVLSEILAVLLDNARLHGAGTVTIVARPAGTGVVIDVCDEGAGIEGDVAAVFRRRSPEAVGHGIGLALARSLAEAHDARLDVARARPRPIFSVALPGAVAAADLI